MSKEGIESKSDDGMVCSFVTTKSDDQRKRREKLEQQKADILYPKFPKLCSAPISGNWHACACLDH